MASLVKHVPVFHALKCRQSPKRAGARAFRSTNNTGEYADGGGQASTPRPTAFAGAQCCRSPADSSKCHDNRHDSTERPAPLPAQLASYRYAFPSLTVHAAVLKAENLIKRSFFSTSAKVPSNV